MYELGFIDDFTAWRTAPTCAETTRKLQSDVLRATARWSRESGAIFEADKTGFIHFERRPTDLETRPRRSLVNSRVNLQVIGTKGMHCFLLNASHQFLDRLERFSRYVKHLFTHRIIWPIFCLILRLNEMGLSSLALGRRLSYVRVHASASISNIVASRPLHPS